MDEKSRGSECHISPREGGVDADVLPGTASRPEAGEPLESLIRRALTRRALLKGTAVAGASLVIGPAAFLKSDPASAVGAGDPGDGHRGSRDPGARLRFATVPPGSEPDIVVPPNYQVDVVLRWGDPLFPGAPDFDHEHQTPEAQARQFGFNADLVLWYPLPRYVREAIHATGKLDPLTAQRLGSGYPELKHARCSRALVVVNHEYTTGGDMFPGYDSEEPSRNEILVEIEAHGFSIVELVLDEQGRWHFDRHSPFNRRVTGSTPIEICGPLRGKARLQTTDDPHGTTVLGCLNNCAGGKTPWGTILTCEENFDQYFANFEAVTDTGKDLSLRIPAPGGASDRKWEREVPRFDLAQEPNEYNRFGYIVEIDPYDPDDKPKKRTAMGRFKHEGAAARVAANGRVAIYSGDDAIFEYVYKFVTKGRYHPDDRCKNLHLLDEGTLYVARFDIGDDAGDDMGTGEWLELSTENPALSGWTMEEILLNTRGAADVVGATPMDRPEDIEVQPNSGKVYIALTNNSSRDDVGEIEVNGRLVDSGPDEANPRSDNPHGHIIELVEDGDATGLRFHWNIFVKCGDPTVPEHDTRFGDIAGPASAGVSPISDPDNLVHDDDGNLWIATDGMPGSSSVGFGQNDGIFAVPVEGPDRGLLRQFLSGVPGGEVCGPEFSGDNRTFFCAIQHPYEGEGVDFAEKWPVGERVSRPSLIAVREVKGEKIGC